MWDLTESFSRDGDPSLFFDTLKRVPYVRVTCGWVCLRLPPAGPEVRVLPCTVMPNPKIIKLTNSIGEAKPLAV